MSGTLDVGSRMNRRELITLLSSTAIAWASTAHGQSPKPVIGFLRNTTPDESVYLLTALRKGLNEAGYVEGENLAIEYRWGGGHQDQLRNLADDLIRQNVSLIIGAGDAAIIATRAATTTLPIVFVTGDDPVKLGYVVHLNRPGGTATGVTFLSDTLRTKQLELLHELVPNSSVIGMLVNPKIPATKEHIREQQAAARTLGLSLQIVEAGSERDLAPAFASLADNRAGALYVDGDSLFTGLCVQLAALATQHAMPTMYDVREFADAGGLMSYGASITDAYRQAGVYAGRILKGEKPADLPVVQPTKFELVINLKTAKVLGLKVPTSMQLLADDVIE
jgi:putative tryptophan/tyrosine transport system substrate-binding protein